MITVILAAALVVRLYDTTALSHLDRASAVAVASGILSAASVPTTWPECGAAPKPKPKREASAMTSVAGDNRGNGSTGETEERRTNGDVNAFICSRPMDTRELAIRIVRDSEGSRHAHSPERADRTGLGYALVDRGRGSGTLATVYLDRVERMAADSATPAPVLLGRAIAHEIGHLLLGDNSHTPDGLMRAIWSHQMLQRNAAADWRFSSEEAAALQLALEKAQGARRKAQIQFEGPSGGE